MRSRTEVKRTMLLEVEERREEKRANDEE